MYHNFARCDRDNEAIAANEADDCNGNVANLSAVFYEWNACVQLTTWKPVPSVNAKTIPPGPIDYASKR